MPDIQLTRTGSTNAPLTVSGTVQGKATLTSDFMTVGFDSFTATTWSATIPANQATKDLTISFVQDLLLEADESIFLTVTSPPGGGQTALVTLTTDDRLILSRVVSGGVQMIGHPTVTGAVAGARVVSGTNNKVISYPAANQVIYNSTADRLSALGGGFCLIEFEVSTYAPAGSASRFIFEMVAPNTAYMKCEYKNNNFNWTVRGGQAWTIPHPSNTVAVWQVEHQGGVVKFWLNGYLVWTTTYEIDVVAGTITHRMTSGAQGGCNAAGCKIRAGRFDWTPGEYSA